MWKITKSISSDPEKSDFVYQNEFMSGDVRPNAGMRIDIYMQDFPIK